MFMFMGWLLHLQGQNVGSDPNRRVREPPSKWRFREKVSHLHLLGNEPWSHSRVGGTPVTGSTLAQLLHMQYATYILQWFIAYDIRFEVRALQTFCSQQFWRCNWHTSDDLMILNFKLHNSFSRYSGRIHNLNLKKKHKVTHSPTCCEGKWRCCTYISNASHFPWRE